MTGAKRPACPPWCDRLHAYAVPQFHLGGGIMPVCLADDPDGDMIGAYAAQRDGEPPSVNVTGRVSGRNEPDALLSVPQAEAVARVVELLAGTGPEVHRDLAAAIRRAVTVITREEA